MEHAFEADLLGRLENQKQAGLWRQMRAVPRGCISFCDNDYLGLASDPRIRDDASQFATGGAASRLVAGEHELYEKLESTLAQMKGTQAARVFTSGFAMNSSVIPTLAGKQDLILVDRLSHASLMDGIKLSQASFRPFAHNDLEQLQSLLEKYRQSHRHVFIITESVFSMDGDQAPITEMLALAEQYDGQLMVDDAHGFGLLPPLPKHPRLIQLGTLSKAVGSLGGYICASQIVIDYLTNHCRSLIYTTALPPMVLAASVKALEIMQMEPERGQKALEHARSFTKALELPEAQSAIVPFILGEEDRASQMAQALQKQGFYTVVIRPPTVPKGTSRLRFTFTARHSRQQVEQLVEAVKALR